MVVFTCDACGESVKKGQVEKHVNICRNCQCLSCMDCGKDFWGDDYKCHVKCVSEDQKYGGKGYEAKAHKGDLKQQEWLKNVHEAIKRTNIDPKVQDILEQMHAYDNIPRKKSKFQNWMTNSLKIHSSVLQDQVWEIFSEATRKGPNEKQEKAQESAGSQLAKSKARPAPLEDTGIQAEKPGKKKNKRERKEERQNSKKEKKEFQLQSQQENFGFKKGKKSKKDKVKPGAESETMPQSTLVKGTKKKQRIASVELEMNGSGFHLNEPGTKAKKRKHSVSEGDSPTLSKIIKNAETEENEAEHSGKFSWKGTIKTVLKQAPNNEISVKKLRKKVIAQYYAVAGENHKSEEQISALFNKKVKKNPKFRVLKEKVQLLQ